MTPAATGARPGRRADGYGYEQLAGDLEAVLDAFELPRAVIAGASMGAHTAARLRAAAPRAGRRAGPDHTRRSIPPSRASPAALAAWDALATGLREGGVEGFVAAYEAHREVPERYRETLLTVLRQRLSAHEHPDAVADALQRVPRSRPFEASGRARADRRARPSWSPAATSPIPSIRSPSASATPTAIPGARLLVEEPGRSPLAWQGGQLSRVLAELARHAAFATDVRT